MDQEKLLEVLEKVDSFFQAQNKDYWIIGGVAVAGLNESFFRDNEDIDLLIWRNNFNGLVEQLRNKFEKFEIYPYQRNERDRIYIRQNNKNIIEIIPIETNDKYFYIKFADDKNIDNKIKYLFNNLLKKQEKQINDVKFIIPSKELIYILTRRHYEYADLQKRDDVRAKKIVDLIRIVRIIGKEKIAMLDNNYFNNKPLILAGRL